MVSLVKNRVFTISSIESLGMVGFQLLDTGHTARAKWVECTDQLDYIGSRVPASIKSAQLADSLEQAKNEFARQAGNYIDYDMLAWTLRKTAVKLTNVMPCCDADAADITGMAASAVEISISMLEALKAYIETAGTEINTESYAETLALYASSWQKEMREVENAVEYSGTLVKGLPDYTKYHGDPVNMSTGNFIYSYKDLSVKGELPLQFSRFYNAMDKNDGSLGRGWIHNWEMRLLLDRNDLTLIHQDGREEPFCKKDENTYLSSMDKRSEIKRLDDSFLYRTGEKQLILFDEEGRMTHLMNEAGDAIVLLYEEGHLVKVQADTGDYLELEYNERKQLARVSDHSGRSILFTYDRKKLTGVTDPLGQTMHYSYGKNGRIDQIRDKRDIPILKNEYDEYRRITRQEFPDGGIIKLRYLDDRNRIYFTEQNGNEIVYVHDSQFRNIRTGYEDGTELYSYDESNNCTSYTDKNGNTTTYEYNDENRLTAVTDPLSGRRTARYDEEGRILERTEPDGGRITYSYDEQGRLTELTDALGNTSCLTYDGKRRQPRSIRLSDGGELKLKYDHRGNILSIAYPDGKSMEYTYDSLGRVIQNKDGNGNRTTYFYDGMDRITRVIRSDGKERRYEYNSMGEATRIVDFDDCTARWEYNVLNKPESYTDKEGRTTLMEYDKVWELIRITDPEGGQTGYGYDHLKRLTEVTDACGRRVKFTYDPVGNRTGIYYPDGSCIRYEYDELNRRAAEIDAMGGIKRTFYDNMGRVIKTVDPAGGEREFSYDKAGNKTWEKDVTGAVTGYTYTAIGKIETVTHPTGRIERYHYQAGGKLLKHEKGDGTWESYTYDKAGNILAKRFQDGTLVEYEYDCLNRPVGIKRNGIQEKSYAYDAMGHVTAMEDALGNKTCYRYSPEGNLTGVTDPEGNRAVYTYNGRNELTGILQLSVQDLTKYTLNHPTDMEKAETIPDQELWEIITLNKENNPLHLTLFERNPTGQIETMTDALGRKEACLYDGMGRAASQTDREGRTSTFSYYPGGALKEAVYPDGRSVLLSYDALNNLIRVKDWLGETCFVRDRAGRISEAADHQGNTFRYEWNIDGTKKRIEYPGGQTAEYSYDGMGRPAGAACQNLKLEYRYDELGRLTECDRGNGVKTQYAYDSAGLVNELIHTAKGEILEKLSYRYDRMGNPTYVERQSKEEGYSYTREYGYDRNGRLTTVSRDGCLIRAYSYDGYGNRTGTEAFDRVEAEETESPVKTAYRYNPLNQLMEAGNRKYSYTLNGALDGMEDGENRYGYSYDGMGRLLSITRNGELLQQNEYNGLGARVSAFTKTNGALTVPVRYNVDYTDEYRRILMEKGGRERTYLWQGNSLCGIPEEESYVLTDALNTPIRLLDGNGSTLNTYRYNEFGVLEDKKEEPEFPFGFTGYPIENAVNLYYANAREYDGESGRFLSKDQNYYMDLKDPNTLNLYQYGKGNPLKYVDYSGHKSIREKNYFEKSLEMAIGGSFSDEFTWLGFGMSLLLSFTPIDWVCDARDLVADLTVNRDVTSLEWWKVIGIDLIAFIPVIGNFAKYGDEAAMGGKALLRNGDELLEGGRRIEKAADAIGDLSRLGRTKADDIIDSLKAMVAQAGKKIGKLDDVKTAENAAENVLEAGAKNFDEAAEAAAEATKRVDDVVEGGADALSKPSSKVLRQNMMDAGIEVPDYPNAAHHIVAGSSPKAAEARAILQKYGIDINDAANGVFLPMAKEVAEGAYHPSLHTNKYYDEINSLLSDVTSKQEALDVLEYISEALQDGTFME